MRPSILRPILVVLSALIVAGAGLVVADAANGGSSWGIAILFVFVALSAIGGNVWAMRYFAGRS